MEGAVIWHGPNGRWFGLNIHVPPQFIWIGTAPYYKIAWDEEGENNWFTPVDDPAKPFTFPALGYQIEVRPTCGSYSISVSINVSKPHTNGQTD